MDLVISYYEIHFLFLNYRKEWERKKCVCAIKEKERVIYIYICIDRKREKERTRDIYRLANKKFYRLGILSHMVQKVVIMALQNTKMPNSY